ncbi:MAG: Multiple EGF-like-domain protein 3 precursor [Deltaproteobacteria bacterium]|nr:Multiple EGF-like-domain protein 3 precursor [Deltaproteobacteria bacterium]
MIDPRTLALALGLALFACGDDGGRSTDAPPSSGSDLTIEIHRDFPFVDGDTADDAKLVAVQDGDGAFVAVTGVNGVYHAHITSDRYGIAIGCLDTDFATIEVVQQVVADGTTYRTACKSTPATARLDVTVQNLPAGHRLRLRTNRNIGLASSDETVSIDVPPGTTELFGTLTDSAKNVVKLFRIPAIEVQTTKAITIDVAADGAAPDNLALTLTPSDPTATVRTSAVRTYGTVNFQGLGIPLGASPTYLMLPPALQQADDLYLISVSGQSSSHSRTVKTPGQLAFALPAAFTAPQPMMLKTPFLHPVFTFTPTIAVLPIQSYTVDASNFSDFNAPVLRDWFATLSAAWVAGAPSIRYEFPDLSALPGFAELALRDRERIDTTIFRTETTSEVRVDGAESTSSSASGVIGEFCGDGVLQDGEMCDPGETETATCDSDCTPVECGDNVVNVSAGEDCDPPDGTTCSATCTAL